MLNEYYIVFIQWLHICLIDICLCNSHWDAFDEIDKRMIWSNIAMEKVALKFK